MADTTIRFDDGAGYERMMGIWSRLAGERFLDWLRVPQGLRWVDVGCGNGAFTELLVSRCAPSAVTGIDPSGAQLQFARTRPGTAGVTYVEGDAMALPFDDGAFDAASMALVLFFVPQPDRGVAEMVRVVRSGGLVCAYAWDILGGGFPLAPLQEAQRELGVPVVYPPSVEAADLERMRALWSAHGLRDVETTTIEVERSFRNFDELWEISMLSASLANRVASLPSDVVLKLKDGYRRRVAAGTDGRITCRARANAVKGSRA